MSVEHGRHRTTGHSGRPLARFGACQNLQVDRVTEGSLTKAALVEGVADVADLPKTRAELSVGTVLGSIGPATEWTCRRSASPTSHPARS